MVVWQTWECPYPSGLWCADVCRERERLNPYQDGSSLKFWYIISLLKSHLLGCSMMQ